MSTGLPRVLFFRLCRHDLSRRRHHQLNVCGSSRWCTTTGRSSFAPIRNVSSSNADEASITPRCPRILFFGGDMVSVTTLHALCTRLGAIYDAHQPVLKAWTDMGALPSSARPDVWSPSCMPTSLQQGVKSPCTHGLGPPPAPRLSHPHPEQTSIDVEPHREANVPLEMSSNERKRFIASHITVVAPSIPAHLSPSIAAERYSRQYPVVRYAVQHHLPIFIVDHPVSLAKSTLLKEMLEPVLPARWQRQTWCWKADGEEQPQHQGSTRDQVPRLHWSKESSSASVTTSSSAVSDPIRGVLSSDPSNSKSRTTEYNSTMGTATTTSASGLQQAFDVSVVVSFRYFLPARLLKALPAPVLNVHPSLLPLYRGASPIFSTLLRRHEAESAEGEVNGSMRMEEQAPRSVAATTQGSHDASETVKRMSNSTAPLNDGGVTIIELSADQPVMDGGRIVWQRRVPLDKQTDLRTYFPLVTQIGAAGCCEVIFGPAVMDEVLDRNRNGQKDISGDVRFSATATSGITDSSVAQLHRWYRERSRGDSCLLPSSSFSSPSSADADPPPRILHTIRSPHLDWPRCLQAHLAAAVPQVYPRYDHYTKDPYHAPMLPKDAAMLHFEIMTDREAFGVWRAFAGGSSFTSTVNTVLHKCHCPVGVELLHRALRRVLRGAHVAMAGKPQQQLMNINKKKNQKELVGDVRIKGAVQQDKAMYRDTTEDFASHRHDGEGAERPRRQPQTVGVSIMNSSLFRAVHFTHPLVAMEPPLLDHPSSDSITPLPPKAPRIDHKTEMRQRDSGAEKASSLEHPPLGLHRMAACPRWMALAMQEGGLQQSCSFTEALHPDLVPQAVRDELVVVERTLREWGTAVRQMEEGPASTAFPSSPSVEVLSTTRTAAGTYFVLRPPLWAVTQVPTGEATIPTATSASFSARAELPRQGKTFSFSTLAVYVSTASQSGGVSVPSLHPSGPSTRSSSSPFATTDDENAAGGGIRETMIPMLRWPGMYMPHTVLPLAAADTVQMSAREETKKEPFTSYAFLSPGSLYFPLADPSLGAVKCRDGWFYWRAAHLKGSPTSSQPAALLRKGLAMKCGTVYISVFCSPPPIGRVVKHNTLKRQKVERNTSGGHNIN